MCVHVPTDTGIPAFTHRSETPRHMAYCAFNMHPCAWQGGGRDMPLAPVSCPQKHGHMEMRMYMCVSPQDDSSVLGVGDRGPQPLGRGPVPALAC